MRRFVSLLLFLILINATFITCAFSDDECSESNIKIQSIANNFNRKIKSNIGNGTFDVKKIGDGGPNTRFAITYKIDQKKYPEQVAIRNPDVDPYDISTGNFDGLSSLIFYYRFGLSGGVGCGFAIYPHAGQFNVLQLPYPFSIIDTDKDGNEKIVSQEVESWAYDCEFSNATYPRWPRIFKLDTNIGKLVDVSSKSPEVYKEKYIEYSPEIKKEINDLLSPQCKAKFSKYIENLQKSGKITENKNIKQTDGQINEKRDFDGTGKKEEQKSSTTLESDEKDTSLSQSGAYPNEPDGFMGMKWGEALNFGKIKSIHCKKVAVGALDVCEIPEEKLQDQGMYIDKINYIFWREKLWKGVLYFSNKQNINLVRNMLLEKHKMAGEKIVGSNTNITIKHMPADQRHKYSLIYRSSVIDKERENIGLRNE